MKKHITTSRILIASIVVFVICLNMTNTSNGRSHGFVAFMGFVSTISILACFIVMIISLFRRKKKKLEAQDKSQPSPILLKFEKTQVNNDDTQPLSEPETTPQQLPKKNQQESRPHDDQFRNDLAYDMKNGVALIWQGLTKTASIKLCNETKRRTGLITRLTIHDDGEFYIDLTNDETGEILSIKERDITTQFVVGSTRYDFMDLCRKVFKLDLSEMFEYVNAVRREAKRPQLIATFEPVDISFTYESRENGKTKRTVSVNKYLKNNEGGDYISGYCHARKEDRIFKASYIKSKIKTADGKYYYFNEWLTTVYNSNN